MRSSPNISSESTPYLRTCSPSSSPSPLAAPAAAGDMNDPEPLPATPPLPAAEAPGRFASGPTPDVPPGVIGPLPAAPVAPGPPGAPGPPAPGLPPAPDFSPPIVLGAPFGPVGAM